MGNNKVTTKNKHFQSDPIEESKDDSLIVESSAVADNLNNKSGFQILNNGRNIKSMTFGTLFVAFTIIGMLCISNHE